jgi:hypothetical protein
VKKGWQDVKDGWWYPSPGLALPNLVYTISGVMQAL